MLIYICVCNLCLFKERKNLTLKTCAPDFSARSMTKLYAKIKGARAITLFDFPKTWQVCLSNEDTCNTAVTDAVSEILWKERYRKRLWVTRNALDLCDEKRKLKKRWYEAERAERQGSKDSEGCEESKEGLGRCSVREDLNLPELKQHRESIPADERSLGTQCEQIEICLN